MVQATSVVPGPLNGSSSAHAVLGSARFYCFVSGPIKKSWCQRLSQPLSLVWADPYVNPCFRAEGHGDFAIGRHIHRLFREHIENVEFCAKQSKFLQLEVDIRRSRILAQVRYEGEYAVLRVLEQGCVALLRRYSTTTAMRDH